MTPLLIPLAERLAPALLAVFLGSLGGYWLGSLYGRVNVAECQRSFAQYQTQAEQTARQQLAEIQRHSQENALAYRLEESASTQAHLTLSQTFRELTHEAHALPAALPACALNPDGLRLWAKANASAGPQP